MPQIHRMQFGTFHCVTKTHAQIPWCTYSDIPKRLIEHLTMTRNMQQAKLDSFCILPDHVHMIICPGPNGLSKFMHAFKKDSTRDIAACNHAAPFSIKWQKNYYDEKIRSERQRDTVVAYVRGNAVKHGLVKDAIDWPWTSMHFQDLIDPMDLWINDRRDLWCPIQ